MTTLQETTDAWMLMDAMDGGRKTTMPGMHGPITATTTASSCHLRSGTPPSKHLIDADKLRFLPPFPSFKRRHHRQRSASVSTISMTSPEEYAALPPPIQKKYFSAQERFNIIQQAALHHRRKARSRDMRARPTPSFDLTPRPKTSQGLRRPSHLSMATSNPDQDGVTEEDAQWFHALPEKIRRLQFSREEQMLFTARPAKPIDSPLLAPTEVPPVPAQPPLPNGSSAIDHALQRPSVGPSAAMARPEGDMGKITAFFDSGASTDSAGMATDADVAELELSTRKASTASSHKSTSAVKDEPPSLPDASLPTIKLAREKTAASRALALTPIRLPPPRLKPVALPSKSSPPTVRRALSSPKLIESTTSHKPLAEEGQEIKSYHDQEARRQLREVLATPSRFDEVLLFGFATGAQQAATGQSARSASSLPPSSVHRRPSLEFSVEGDDADDRSVNSLGADPVTPRSVSAEPLDNPSIVAPTKPLSAFSISSESEGSMHSVHHVTSLEPPTAGYTGAPRPYHLPLSASPSAITFADSFSPSRERPHEREMTIRMTLTRPDLRTPSPAATHSTMPFSFFAASQSETNIAAEKKPKHLITDENAPNMPSEPSAPGLPIPNHFLSRPLEDDPLALAPLPQSEDDSSGERGVFALDHSRRRGCSRSLSFSVGGSRSVHASRSASTSDGAHEGLGSVSEKSKAASVGGSRLVFPAKKGLRRVLKGIRVRRA